MTIHVGDVRDVLPSIGAGSVQCVATSPPYWGLRDYGVKGQIGLEPTLDGYVETMVEVFREVRRVLAEDGVCWIEVGDRRLKGQLALVPSRLEIALHADGWLQVGSVIWAKGASFNAAWHGAVLPGRRSRYPNSAHTRILMLAKHKDYFYDKEHAVEEASKQTHSRGKNQPTAKDTDDKLLRSKKSWRLSTGRRLPDRAYRDVWAIGTGRFKAAHFATFPPALVEPMIKAGSRKGDTVLDPFAGSGTTGIVAQRLGRGFIGIELNPEYAQMARGQIDGPLFAEAT